MDGENKLEIFLVCITIILDIIVFFLVNHTDSMIPLIIANAIFILFYLIPKIKKYQKKLAFKKKSNFIEGEIYDIIICYEMIYLYIDKVIKYESPEAREYPVIIFQNTKGEWEKVIGNESNPGEYCLGDNVKVWYRYGRKERIQILDNTFLGKTYQKINISVNEITKIDNSFIENEITLYHKNTKADLSEYKRTLIMHGKNLIVEKVKVK